MEFTALHALFIGFSNANLLPFGRNRTELRVSLWNGSKHMIRIFGGEGDGTREDDFDEGGKE